MEENTIDWLDMSQWPEGPWKSEPNVDVFKYRGYDCIINRSNVGALCGYVRVPKNSKFIDEKLYSRLDVHGGITYTEKDEDGDFWIGFDCSHHDDIIPIHGLYEEHMSDQLKHEKQLIKSMVGDPLRINKTYKDFDFVTNEIMNIVDQMMKKKRIITKMTHRRNING